MDAIMIAFSMPIEMLACWIMVSLEFLGDKPNPLGIMNLRIVSENGESTHRLPLWAFPALCRIIAWRSMPKAEVPSWVNPYNPPSNHSPEMAEWAKYRGTRQSDARKKRKIASAYIAPSWRRLCEAFVQDWPDSLVPTVQKRFLGWYGDVPSEMMSKKVLMPGWLDNAATKNYPIALFKWDLWARITYWNIWADLRWTFGATDCAEDVRWHAGSRDVDWFIRENFLEPRYIPSELQETMDDSIKQARVQVSGFQLGNGKALVSKWVADQVSIQYSILRDFDTRIPMEGKRFPVDSSDV